MIEYKLGTKDIDWTSLVDMYTEVDGVIGLARAGQADKIKKAFLNTYKVVTAWDNKTIVGAGRMISDGECYGWIHDIGVRPSYQKKGIGKGIMDHLMEGEHLLFGLTSSFVAEEFYDKLGFKKHKTAMAKYPGPSTYLED
ncbi:GNAT family N-acetyltransferase [Acidaminobacter sp. JC074]|uniref:GNAT family N-acetyltransferase n=1 Tax=Acidaminobacter sp. JC074 TaxID=2530199 RepID=UPI001F0F5088|nr:GNAT family N-acetyltransferase [Acidaminobacter sp. JC074]MCH4888026.1 GNAT family N-acetyltransferase [Acidaminobacter sp. JC074]